MLLVEESKEWWIKSAFILREGRFAERRHELQFRPHLAFLDLLVPSLGLVVDLDFTVVDLGLGNCAIAE